MAHLASSIVFVVALCVGANILLVRSNVEAAQLDFIGNSKLAKLFTDEKELVRRASYRWIVKRQDALVANEAPVEKPTGEEPPVPTAAETTSSASSSADALVPEVSQSHSEDLSGSGAQDIDDADDDKVFEQEARAFDRAATEIVSSPNDASNSTAQPEVSVTAENEISDGENSTQVQASVGSTTELPVVMTGPIITEEPPTSNNTSVEEVIHEQNPSTELSSEVSAPLEQTNSTEVIEGRKVLETDLKPVKAKPDDTEADAVSQAEDKVEPTVEAEEAISEKESKAGADAKLEQSTSSEDKVNQTEVATGNSTLSKSVDRDETAIQSEKVDGTILEQSPTKSVDSKESLKNATEVAVLAAKEAAANKNQARDEEPAYRLDRETCGRFLKQNNNVPELILNSTVERILNSIKSEDCAQRLGLKLKPARNMVVAENLMDVSSMSMMPKILLDTDATLVRCMAIDEGNNTIPADKSTRFRLEFVGNVSSVRQIRALWRLYNPIESDEAEFFVMKQKRAQQGSRSPLRPRKIVPGKSRTKCQRFKFESGSVSLVLSPFRSETVFEIKLAAGTNKDTDEKPQIRMVSYRTRSLRLDTVLHKHRTLSGPERETGSANATGASISRTRLVDAKSTVQIVHDRNQHYRRNYWLLDMYSNWLKHEYKFQLQWMFVELGAKFNVCLQ